jgi:hypothetical protein
MWLKQILRAGKTLTGKVTMAADVLIADHGSVALFTPMTPVARQWVEEHTSI